jgi:hypothetical protein
VEAAEKALKTCQDKKPAKKEKDPWDFDWDDGGLDFSWA